MDEIRRTCSSKWPSIAQIDAIYSEMGKESLLRKFASNCMAFNIPFKKFVEESKEYGEWQAVLEKHQDLAVDVVCAYGKVWGDSRQLSSC